MSETRNVQTRGTVLVTGASRGIGRAIALAAAREGHDVVVHCRTGLEQARAVCDEIAALGAAARVLAFDVGAELRVLAQCELMGDNGLGMFDCRIENGGRVVAHGRISVFEPPQDSREATPDGAPGRREE